MKHYVFLMIFLIFFMIFFMIISFFLYFMKKHVFFMRNIYDCIYDFETMVFVFYEM